MHKIFDLREMDIERLHALAEELGIKGFKKMDKDALVYSILDEEAKKNALNAPDRPEKPRRARIRKETKTEPAAAEVVVNESVAEAPKAEVQKAEPAQQKKRNKKAMLFLCKTVRHMRIQSKVDVFSLIFRVEQKF